MMYTTFAFLGLLCGILSHAFVPTAHRAVASTRLYSTTEEATNLDDMVRAVDCASHFGKCNIELLHELADKVDIGSDTCWYETEDANLCEKEIQDRKDMADLLRLQAELRLGMEYLNKANLFSADVMAEKDMRERDLEMEILAEDGI